MPKNLFQDMVKVKNSSPKTLQKEMVRPTTVRQSPRMEEVKKYPSVKKIPRQEFSQREIPEYREFKENKNTKSRHGLWLVAFISIIFFIFALSFLFARATVTVNPKVNDFALDKNWSAIKDINSNGLSFDLVIISGEEVKKVSGGEEKEVSLNSKGKVFIYNTFSALPQKLANNTKLEGSNGKFYKTSSEVTVPGMNIDGTAGKIEVGILGMEAGQEYNSEPLDFTLSGFKGTPKYSKFYGRSNGAITGGFKGKTLVIAEEEQQKVFNELKVALKDKLLQKAIDQIPNGFILFKDAAFLNIDEEGVEFTSEDGNTPVKVKGTLYGFLFSEKELTTKIAKDSIANYDDSEVYIPNIKDLVFTMIDKDISFSDVQNINFNLSGNAKVVWKFDDASFAGSLLGKSKNDFNQILSEYPHVDSAELELSPFWVRSIPSKLKDIKVIVNYPK